MSFNARLYDGRSIIFEPRLTTAKPLLLRIVVRSDDFPGTFDLARCGCKGLVNDGNLQADARIPSLRTPGPENSLAHARKPSRSPTSPKTESMACTPAAWAAFRLVAARKERLSCRSGSSPPPGRPCNLPGRLSWQQSSRSLLRWQMHSQSRAPIPESASAIVGRVSP